MAQDNYIRMPDSFHRSFGPMVSKLQRTGSCLCLNQLYCLVLICSRTLNIDSWKTLIVVFRGSSTSLVLYSLLNWKHEAGFLFAEKGRLLSSLKFTLKPDICQPLLEEYYFFSYLSERTFSWKYMNIYVDFSLRLFVMTMETLLKILSFRRWQKGRQNTCETRETLQELPKSH